MKLKNEYKEYYMESEEDYRPTEIHIHTGTESVQVDDAIEATFTQALRSSGYPVEEEVEGEQKYLTQGLDSDDNSIDLADFEDLLQVPENTKDEDLL